LEVKNIFVETLATKQRKKKSNQLFEQFGTVDRVSLITDRDGPPRGFGFCEMPNGEEGDAAIEQLNGDAQRTRIEYQ
jgi:RNA recognition motif-containing protein